MRILASCSNEQASEGKNAGKNNTYYLSEVLRSLPLVNPLGRSCAAT